MVYKKYFPTKGWKGPPDCYELNELQDGALRDFFDWLQESLVGKTVDRQQIAYEKCFIRLLAENDRDDWMEIILYFKDNILPIASDNTDIGEGQYKVVLWRFSKIVVQKESMSFIINNILPRLVKVDKETLEKLDSAIHSKAYDVVLHVGGFSDIGAKILLDLGDGKLFCAVVRGALYGALSAIGKSSLFPKVSAIFDAFAAGNYLKAMMLIVALPIYFIAKGLLWLLPIPYPIGSILLDTLYNSLVNYI